MAEIVRPSSTSQSPAVSCRPSSTQAPRQQRGRRYSPQEYADAVDAYKRVSARDSAFSGSHFSSLSNFLSQPYVQDLAQGRRVDSRATLASPYDVVVFYDLKDKDNKSHTAFRGVDQFLACFDCRFWGKDHGSLLFLCGYQSPEWLNAIGATFDIDPEFYRRHLYYQATDRKEQYCSRYPLSSMINMARLRITTIGVKMRNSTTEDQDELDKLRHSAAQEMLRYKTRLSSSSGLAVGDSIVRRFAVHHHDLFSIEQDISIYVSSTPNDYFVAVWSDLGRDLAEGPTGPWRSEFGGRETATVTYLPTVQHRHSISTRNRPRRRHPSIGTKSDRHILQNASLLPYDYGKGFDQETAASDPLYALQDVFFLAAASEVQFLNLIESVLREEHEILGSPQQISSTKPTTTNFLYNRQVLRRHISRLKENIEFIKSADLRWPKSPQQHQRAKAELTVNSISRDFQYLLERAQALMEECDRGMSIVMHNANIQESREAVAQAKQMAKLTQLAFVFVPLSFTTSFFGMNFKEIVPGSPLNVYVWFVISVPLLAASFVFLFWDVPMLLYGVVDIWRQSRGRNREDKSEFELF